MKKRFTCCLRLLVLLVMACNMNGAFAYNLSSGYSDGKETHLADKENGFNITNSITIENKRSFLYPLVPEEKTFVVLTGDVTISNGKTLTVANGATLIIEGDLIIGNKATLNIYGDGIVIVKRKIKAQSSNNDVYLIDILQGSYLICYGGVDKNKIDFHGLETDEQYLYGYAPYNDETSTAFEKAKNETEYAKSKNLLPIELTSFTVSATEYGYTFNWVTASEENNDYFTLEYSINGVDFSEIDYVHGAGTTSETSEYTYRWDDAPNFEMMYFRLKQTDYNGEYTYSDVIVSCRKKSAGATRTFRYGPLNLQVVDGELRYIAE